MLLMLSLAIAGKVAGSLLRTQGYSPEPMFPVPYARSADLEPLRQVAVQIGAYDFSSEPSQAA